MPIRGPDCMPFDTGSARATMSWLSAHSVRLLPVGGGSCC